MSKGMKRSPFRPKFDFLTHLLNMRKAFGIKEVKIATVYSTYKYQDDHDTDYLRRLLR